MKIIKKEIYFPRDVSGCFDSLEQLRNYFKEIYQNIKSEYSLGDEFLRFHEMLAFNPSKSLIEKALNYNNELFENNDLDCDFLDEVPLLNNKISCFLDNQKIFYGAGSKEYRGAGHMNQFLIWANVGIPVNLKIDNKKIKDVYVTNNILSADSAGLVKIVGKNEALRKSNVAFNHKNLEYEDYFLKDYIALSINR